MEPQRDFQRRVGKLLQERKSVLQVAPTGLGKTRAAVEPFTSGTGGPLVSTRLLYALPLRALAEGILKSITDLDPNARPAVHTGEHPESMIFSERACITTIDQYLAAFAGAPLSSFTDSTTRWRYGRAKVGHAVAGAVLTSYSVFDEVHLLDPKNGLQLLMAVLAQRRRWGLLSTVSTATLPRSVISYLTKDKDGPELELVEPSPEDIKGRDDHRKVALELALDAAGLPMEQVMALAVRGVREHGKVILFANTVDRAIADYQALKDALKDDVGVEAMLIHSRFAPDDRRKKEEQVRDWFGEGSQQRAVLVTTQVAEAGLNISAPLVLTELAPADSLIQRAGRCARFVPRQGEVTGTVVVFRPTPTSTDDPEAGLDKNLYWMPYPETLVKRTERALPDVAGLLTWESEQALVNAALDEVYGEWVTGKDFSEDEDKKGQPSRKPRPGQLRPVDALGPFERAFRTQSPNEVEEILRNPERRPLSVQVAVLGSVEEASAGLAAYEHPVMVAVPFGVFYRAVRDQQGLQVWEIDPAAARHGDRASSLTRTTQVRPGQTYLMLAAEAGYSSETGLTLRGEGTALGWRPKTAPDQQPHDEGREQTFVEHSTGAFERAGALASHYRPFLEAWAQAVFGGETDPHEVSEWLADAMMAAALFHDVGKLQKDWQHAVGWTPGTDAIARFKTGKGKRPDHAAYAYPFLQTLFREANGRDAYLRPLDFIALAAARHHSLGVNGSIKPGEFRPFDREKALAELKTAAKEANFGIEDEWVEAAFGRLLGGAADWKMEPYYADEAPGPSDDFYPVYCIAQRLLKIADWEDAGDRPIELQRQGASDENADAGAD